jgi:penicillin-insensitive murein endopeptidase
MTTIPRLALLVIAVSCIGATAALAQDRGTLDPKPLPPLRNPQDPHLAAKELFGRESSAAALPPKAIGSYARGCVAGAVELPEDGTTWQVMRLSRNRNWGHPDLVAFLERLAKRVPETNGWPGLLFGDMAQPRGGPMITGHASHQIGLDADVWLTPMPDRRLSRAEREEMSAVDMVRDDRRDIDPTTWTAAQMKLIRSVAKEGEVARIFVNPAIKRALCRDAGDDRAWLRKVRPMWGHNYHFHIRLSCPVGQPGCSNQDPPPAGDGCGSELSFWFTPAMLHPKPGKPRPPLTLSQLPSECSRVLSNGEKAQN